jgi:PPOX class probable F420-dependent enzyme
MLDLTNPEHAHIDKRLRENRILWLGSVRPDGRPHLVYVWFLWDGKRILIFSQPTSQKIRNARHNPHVSLGLDNTREGEDMVILEGTAELLDDPAVNATLPAYAAKYDSLLKRVGLTAEAIAAIYSQALLITPSRVFHWLGTRGNQVEVITCSRAR